MAAVSELEPQINSLSPLQERLGHIRDMSDPMEQYRSLDVEFSQFPKPERMADIHALIDFAADPGASSSLLVRAQAFEVAYGYLFDSRVGHELLIEDEPDYYNLYDDLGSMMPARYSRRAALIKNPANEYLGDEFVFNPIHPTGGTGAYSHATGNFNPYKYRGMISHLIEKEGLDKDWIYPDWHAINPDYFYGLDDPIPARTLLLLESLSGRIEQYDRGEKPLPVSQLVKLIPLAVEVQKAVADKDDYVFASTENAEAIVRDAKEMSALLNLPGGKEYAYAISGLRSSAGLVAGIFPPEYRDAVRRGAQAMFTDCIYAARAHLENGSVTDAFLPLKNRPEAGLPLQLEDYEPLGLLDYLSTAIHRLSGIVGSDSRPDLQSVATLGVEGYGYKLYRLWRGRQLGTASNSLSVYIRPYGAETYDRDTEYGRNGEGVEASISYVVDPTIEPGEVMELGKHRGGGPDNRISIRLDREGVALAERGSATSRNPVQKNGTLSLDIGSVIGDDDWISTKLGRFLALGNALRAQALHEDVHLNHSIEYFGPEDGDGEVFAGIARKLISEYDGRKLDKKQIKARLLGSVAGRGAGKPE